MDLSFYPLDLAAMDQAEAEALCLFVGEDERPLTGLAGLTDWRLSGGLSRLLRAGVLKGTRGEAVLTPAKRLPFRKLFLFGIGPLAQSDDELAQRVAECMRKLAAAGVQEAALQLPPRLSAELGIRTLVDAGMAVGPDGEPQAPSRALIFGPDPGSLVRALSQAASRGASATHERRVVKVQGPHRPPARPPPAPRPAPPTELPRASPLPFTPSNAAPPRPAAAAASPLAAPAAVAPTPAALPTAPSGDAPLIDASSGDHSLAAALAPAAPATPAAAFAPLTPSPAATAAPAQGSGPASPHAAPAAPASPTSPGVLPWARPIAPPTVKVAGHATGTGAAAGAGAATGAAAGAGTGSAEGSGTAGAGASSAAPTAAAADASSGAAAPSSFKARPPKTQRYIPNPSGNDGNGGKKKKR